MLVHQIEGASVRSGEGPRLHQDLLNEAGPVGLGPEGPARSQQEIEQPRPLPMRLSLAHHGRYDIARPSWGGCRGPEEVRAGVALACLRMLPRGKMNLGPMWDHRGGVALRGPEERSRGAGRDWGLYGDPGTGRGEAPESRCPGHNGVEPQVQAGYALEALEDD